MGSTYNQRLTIDVLLAALILIMLLTVKLDLAIRSIIAANLTDPVNFASGVRTHNQIHLAFTGEPIDNYSLQQLEAKHSKQYFSRTINRFFMTTEGHLAVMLASDIKQINNKLLTFKLGRYSAGNGFQFYNWRCGGYVIEPYAAKPLLNSALLPEYLEPLCRR